jgi:hypothetical protein
MSLKKRQSAGRPAFVEFSDGCVSFSYPEGFRVSRDPESRQYFIEGPRGFVGTIQLVDTDYLPLWRSTLQGPITSSDVVRETTARRDAIQFSHCSGIERLVVGHAVETGEPCGSSWMFLLECEKAHVFVNLISDTVIDEELWLKCLDTLRVQGEAHVEGQLVSPDAEEARAPTVRPPQPDWAPVAGKRFVQRLHLIPNLVIAATGSAGCEERSNPTWEEILAAVDELDAQKYSLLMLEGPDDWYMRIATGGEENFVVSVTHGDAHACYALGRPKAPDSKEAKADAEAGTVDTWSPEKRQVLEVAKAFAENGRMDERYCWHEDYF